VSSAGGNVSSASVPARTCSAPEADAPPTPAAPPAAVGSKESAVFQGVRGSKVSAVSSKELRPEEFRGEPRRRPLITASLPSTLGVAAQVEIESEG